MTSWNVNLESLNLQISFFSQVLGYNSMFFPLLKKFQAFSRLCRNPVIGNGWFMVGVFLVYHIILLGDMTSDGWLMVGGVRGFSIVSAHPHILSFWMSPKILAVSLCKASPMYCMVSLFIVNTVVGSQWATPIKYMEKTSDRHWNILKTNILHCLWQKNSSFIWKLPNMNIFNR